MNSKRAQELINNLLAQISDHIEWTSQEQYLAWLQLEVGFTTEEIEDLRFQGNLPMPDVVKSEERE